MKISRLDKIIEENVTYSQQKTPEMQIVYILQDMSQTLAMIYDKMCGIDTVSQATVPIEKLAYVIPVDELSKHKTMHFEAVDYKEGYPVEFVRYLNVREVDGKTVEKEVRRKAVLNAFGSKMEMDLSSYGKKWRCWNMEPTEEERENEKWAK